MHISLIRNERQIKKRITIRYNRLAGRLPSAQHQQRMPTTLYQTHIHIQRAVLACNTPMYLCMYLVCTLWRKAHRSLNARFVTGLIEKATLPSVMRYRNQDKHTYKRKFVSVADFNHPNYFLIFYKI